MDRNKLKILIADDDREIVGAISKILEKEGYSTLRAYDGAEALELAAANDDIKLIIIDVMMPRMDGLSATMRIREKRNIPIMILSAKSEDTDKVLGISMGADDYISKPFSPSELTARVKAHLRRYLTFGGVNSIGEKGSENIIRNGGLSLDEDAKQVFCDGECVKLTATEYKILELLMKNPGKVFSSTEIYKNVWNEDAFNVENTIMVHIRRIREKIEIDPKMPRYLKVVWGIGYKIEKIG